MDLSWLTGNAVTQAVCRKNVYLMNDLGTRLLVNWQCRDQHCIYKQHHHNRILYMRTQVVLNESVTHSVCVIKMRLDPEIPLHKEASFGSSSPPQLLSLAVQVASHTAGDKNCGGGQQTGLEGIHAEWFFFFETYILTVGGAMKAFGTKKRTQMILYAYLQLMNSIFLCLLFIKSSKPVRL